MIYRNLCKSEAGELLIENLERDLYDADSRLSCVDVDNLATHTEKESNHFTSSTSKGGYLDRNVLRDWLRRLWILRPDLRSRLWKVCMFDKLSKKHLHGLLYVFNYK